MDGQKLDKATAALAAAMDRRLGIKSAVAAVGAAFAGSAAAAADGAKRREHGKPGDGQAGDSQQADAGNDREDPAATGDDPGSAGPCGDGSPKANRCQRNEECCTGNCDTGSGRCRCLQSGRTCATSSNC